MEQQTGEKCAPPVCASSDVLVGFVNTRPFDGRPDELENPSGLAAWLKSRGMPVDGPPITRADSAAAQELRDAFAAIFREHGGCRQEEQALRDAEVYLQSIGRRYPLMLRLGAESGTLVPIESGVPGAFGNLLVAAADLAWRGAWERLKLCKEPSCHQGFFDKTRNSGGQFCTSSCSSRMAARNYRSRLKEGQLKPEDSAEPSTAAS